MVVTAHVSNGNNITAQKAYDADKPMKNDTEEYLKEHWSKEDIDSLERRQDGKLKRAVFAEGVNCNPNNFDKEVKEWADLAYKKGSTTKNTHLNNVISFADDELSSKNADDVEIAGEFGVRLAKKAFPDNQSAVFVQLDSQDHLLHVHIPTGKVKLTPNENGAYTKLNFGRGEYVEYIRDKVDEVAEEMNDEGYTHFRIQDRQKARNDLETPHRPSIEMSERASRQGKSYKSAFEEMRENVQLAAQQATNFEEFKQLYESRGEGYTLQEVPDKKDPSQTVYKYGYQYERVQGKNKGEIKHAEAISESKKMGQYYTKESIDNVIRQEPRSNEIRFGEPSFSDVDKSKNERSYTDELIRIYEETNNIFDESVKTELGVKQEVRNINGNEPEIGRENTINGGHKQPNDKGKQRVESKVRNIGTDDGDINTYPLTIEESKRRKLKKKKGIDLTKEETKTLTFQEQQVLNQASMTAVEKGIVNREQASKHENVPMKVKTQTRGKDIER